MAPLKYTVYFQEASGINFLAILRMYCIDRAGVPESHDAHAFHCLYDQCMKIWHANPGENRMNSKAVRAASVKHKH